MSVPGDPQSPPSTPNDIERVWRVERWRNSPTPYVVKSRTPKTLRAQEEQRKGYLSSYENLVRLSDIGHEWFISESDAWVEIHRCAKAQVEADKAALQRSRTDLRMAESELKRRGIGVDSVSQGDTRV